MLSAGVAPEVAVRKYVVHITSPPDARYAPLSQNRQGQRQWAEVRALVVPVVPDRSGSKFPVLPQVGAASPQSTNLPITTLHLTLVVPVIPDCSGSKFPVLPQVRAASLLSQTPYDKSRIPSV